MPLLFGYNAYTSKGQSIAGNGMTPKEEEQSVAGNGMRPKEEVKSFARNGRAPKEEVKSFAGNGRAPKEEVKSVAVFFFFRKQKANFCWAIFLPLFGKSWTKRSGNGQNQIPDEDPGITFRFPAIRRVKIIKTHVVC